MSEKKDERGFYQRLIDAMKEMENPTKSKKANVPTKSGKSYSYNYETLDDVLSIVRPALAANGLMLAQSVQFDRVSETWILTTGVFDSNDTERVMDARPIPQVQDAQAQGSWETYLRRYALRTAFGLTGEDDDGAATLPAKNQNTSSYANTITSKGNSAVTAINGAKVTEMASDKQMNMIHAKLKELADLRGVSKDNAEAALIASKTMNGASMDNLTKQQASDAITLLITWIDKAQPFYDDGLMPSEMEILES